MLVVSLFENAQCKRILNVEVCQAHKNSRPKKQILFNVLTPAQRNCQLLCLMWETQNYDAIKLLIELLIAYFLSKP